MATRKLRGSWWVDFRWNFVRYRKRSPVNTRAGAAEYELVLRGRILRGEPLEPIRAPDAGELRQNIRFDEFAERWFETYVVTNNKPSEQHVKRYSLRKHIVPWFGGFALSEIGAQHIEQFKANQLAQKLARKTVNNHVSMLRKCLHCAVDWGYLEHQPASQLLRVGPPPFKVLTRDECLRLLADDSEHGWNLMAHLALRTGIRRGELLVLDWSDVNFGRNRVTVRRGLSDGVITDTKTYRIRHLPLAADIRYKLQREAKTSGLIFPNSAGQVYSDSGAEKAIRRISCRVSVEGLGWHTLRHTFATELAAAGVPLHVVKDLLGHSSITMTMRYAHVAPSMLDDAIRVLEQSMDISSCPKSGQPVGNFEQVREYAPPPALELAA